MTILFVCFQGGINKLSRVLEIGNEELKHLAIKVVAVLCKGSAVRVRGHYNTRP